MKSPLSLGIAGLGTVGAGLIRLLADHRARLETMLGRELRVVAVAARDRTRARNCDVSGCRWYDDPVALAKDPEIDVFVELIGGEDGPARAAVDAALRAGKHVVTANKALLAKHGVGLAELAEENGVALNFEAAVAGGIPVVKTLRESLFANRIDRIYGILNGTCNFILTKMQEEGRPFAEVLAEAQALGYAEADPTFDVGGYDTAHKLAILASLAFGTRVAFDEAHVEGIEQISEADIQAADELGYRIKLLGVALRTASGGIELRVNPAMVPKHSAIAEVSGVTNCVAIDGDRVGNLLLVGPGAGSEATASAVASDIVDLARGLLMPPLGTPAALLKPHTRARLGEHQGAYYVRLSVFDKPGAMAAIAGRMGERGVSLESIVQRRPRAAPPGGARGGEGQPAPVTLITHETTEAAIREALDAIAADGKVSERPQMIRIETL